MTLQEFLENTKGYDPYLSLDNNSKPFLYTNQIINAINVASDNRDEEKLELLLFAADWDGLDNSYTKLFCELVVADWHFSQEDIAMMLEEIKDPISVECLYIAALNIPDHDDGCSLAKKCIWALGSINTSPAIEKLKLLAGNNNYIISEVAKMELDNRQ